MDDSILRIVHREFSRYCTLPDGEWQRFISIIKPLRLKKRQYFIDIGQVPDKMCFIVSGLFRVYCLTEDGDEKIMAFRDEYHFLTAFSAFLEGQPSWYAIQAMEESGLISLTLADYNDLMERHSCWNTLTRRYVERLFIEKEKREREFLSEDAAARYLAFRKTHPGLEYRIPQYQVASYLGITPVALSRIRRKLKIR
jgi:CRP-like cAMP-binding protein